MRRIQQVPNAVAYLSPRMLGLTTRAESEAARDGGQVRVRHLLLALAAEVTGFAGAVLRVMDVDAEKVRAALKSLPDSAIAAEVQATQSAVSAGGGAGGNGSGDGSVLARFTRDLIEEASKDRFDPIVGRDGELRRLLQVIARRQKNNPLLVGEAGVGKRAIVYALASRLAQGDVPAPLKKKRLMQLDLGQLVAGAKLRGEMEERLRAIFSAAKDAGRGRDPVR
jgi:ATP-dependent Clp protease ATP-binding subunit ClpB